MKCKLFRRTSSGYVYQDQGSILSVLPVCTLLRRTQNRKKKKKKANERYSVVVKNMNFGIKLPGQTVTLLFPGCETSGGLPHLFMPHFCHLYNEVIVVPTLLNCYEIKRANSYKGLCIVAGT